MATNKTFGKLPDGREVLQISLRNRNGMMARVITYGAAITELHVPDTNGEFADVVLGYNTLADYLASTDYLGCVVGRVAGRIPNGHVAYEDHEFALVTNDGRNHLHGGVTGLNRRLWELVEAEDDKLSLRYHSPDGEEGYPGNVDFLVSYQLTDRNELVVTTRAVSDKLTPATLAQHSYFNLGGSGIGNILDHHVKFFAQERGAVADDLTPLGIWEQLVGTPHDLNRGAQLSKHLPHLFLEHGDCYRVRRSRPGDLVPAARISHENSGRILNVATTEECLQFYTGKYMTAPQPGKHGEAYKPFAGLCLECQGYPAAFGLPGFQSILLHPGSPVRHQTIYAFTVEGCNSCCL